jgi:hypothetical protein
VRGERPAQAHYAVFWDASQAVGRTEVTDLIETAIETVESSRRVYPDLYAHLVTQALIKAGVIDKVAVPHLDDIVAAAEAAASDQWVVSVHTTGGSMGEAVQSLVVLGPYSKEVAREVEKEFRRVQTAKGGYVADELWALAEPLTFPGTNPTAVVEWVVEDESSNVAQYFEG